MELSEIKRVYDIDGDNFTVELNNGVIFDCLISGDSTLALYDECGEYVGVLFYKLSKNFMELYKKQIIYYVWGI